MRTLTEVAALRAELSDLRTAGRSIALVPTMGNLHEGHLQLIDAARAHADEVVATIFVNPLQFGAGEDFDAYPRTLAADQAALAERGTSLLFAPPPREVYPDGPDLATRVRAGGLATELCGAQRPGHFDGVVTVVCKLFNLVTPDVAVFGRKDLQQLTIIRRMVRDLSFATRVIAVDTARADDGLALSSRNGYLSAPERALAPQLHRTLQDVARAIHSGDFRFQDLEAQACASLAAAGFAPDYVEVRLAEALQRPDPCRPEHCSIDNEYFVLGAAHLGRTRLIDNVSTAQSNGSHP